MRMQPMKDVSSKEAAIYCHLRGLATRNWRGWASVNAKGAGSIEMLTERKCSYNDRPKVDEGQVSIAGLSVTHPATVSTINRTGSKTRLSRFDRLERVLSRLSDVSPP